MSRLAKQILYGSLYLLFFILVAWGIYFLFFRPEPSCTNGIRDRGEEGVDCGGACPRFCLPPGVKPLEVVGGKANVFFPEEGHVSVLGKVQNPNPNLAAESFGYRFELYDSENRLLQAIAGTSFIYAGEIRFLAGYARSPANARVRRATLTLERPAWVRREDFTRPATSLLDIDTATTTEALSVRGRAVNRDVLPLSSLSVLAVFKNNLGTPAGVSETALDALEPGESREFVILHPPLSNLDLKRTEVVLVGRRHPSP